MVTRTGSESHTLEWAVIQTLAGAGLAVQAEPNVGGVNLDAIVQVGEVSYGIEVKAGRVFPSRLGYFINQVRRKPEQLKRIILITEEPLSPGMVGWLRGKLGDDAPFDHATVDTLLPMLGIQGSTAVPKEALIEEANAANAQSQPGFVLGRFFPPEKTRALGDKSASDLMEALYIGRAIPQATVLLSDIVNFSTFVKHAPPELLNLTMQKYYQAARQIVWKHNGTLDKFIGDAVLAIFGYPDPDVEAARNAIRAGYDLIERGNKLIEELMDNINDVIDSGTRIGIATGNLAVINLSESGVEPTFVGDVINRSARLEKSSRVNGMLVDRVTFNALAIEEDPFKAGPKVAFLPCKLFPANAKGQALPQWSWHVDTGIARPLASEIDGTSCSGEGLVKVPPEPAPDAAIAET